MRLRSPLAALTAAILNTVNPSQHVSDEMSCSETFHEGYDGASDDPLSSSMSSEQLFDMEFKPTLKLLTKPLEPQPTLQSHDVLMDMIDEQLDMEELDLDEDDISSINSLSPLTPVDMDTGAFLLTDFHPFSEDDSSMTSLLSRLPNISDITRDPADQLEAVPAHKSDRPISNHSGATAAYHVLEVEMVKQYVRDLERGKTWEGTARQGLRAREDRRHHVLDEAPSKRPDEAPLSLLLIENRFAVAVNRAYKSWDPTYQPYPEYRFSLERDPVLNFGVRKPESGSLNELRVERARVLRSGLLPFHPDH
ncbi:hypothetical protein L226DRAFT_563207 [Lentinus tigrinus ALCF2SS1-7]|uniref:Uncharacterized protein n=1 Tax=Lentinus tigrinus ALCF2SS1-6 TaxID=1328759 RepID=A0A5C2RWA9_9APHY|nr:hypothetical protein L227DRAFT_603761 [Lentinus tigrinus ALCF2SS1-6]RPD69718.1 hypothetical protein L226DRAFT_563207 [Lentinus tigrinus ALCF2SS1-7]